MRVLLRDSAGCYYAGAGNWTLAREQATDIRFIEQALLLNTEQHLGATHIILAYDAPACNLTLPITNYASLLAASSRNQPNAPTDRPNRPTV